ncbi:hypothetical protein [Streptomyces sp. NPDC000410]|uniref:hypothetical protein n=1 Tax=Streptomyces sp. NPDC000410 TaxID=3154254 RepID=UPI0033197361
MLGVVAGVCTGYVVQAERPPAALPSLSQPVLAQAKGKGPEPLSAAVDRKVKTEGDLRKLLLTAPKGASDRDSGLFEARWMSLEQYASEFTFPSEAVALLVEQQYRRGARVAWHEDGDRFVEIRLLQFRDEKRYGYGDSGAEAAVHDSVAWAEEETGNPGKAIAGSPAGRYFVDDRPEVEDGQRTYKARAHAWRGDIALEIWIADSRPVSEKKIRDVAQRQWERL